MRQVICCGNSSRFLVSRFERRNSSTFLATEILGDHPNASGGVKAGILALSDRFQVNIRQTSIRFGGEFVLRLLDALNLRDCWDSSAGKFLCTYEMLSWSWSVGRINVTSNICTYQQDELKQSFNEAVNLPNCMSKGIISHLRRA